MDAILEHKLPLTGKPEEVLPFLEDIISSFIDKEKVRHFFLGQSIDLQDTKDRHGCDAVVSLYQSKNSDNVRNIEFKLLKRFYKDPKNYNLEAKSGEETSFKTMNYFYLALWFHD